MPKEGNEMAEDIRTVVFSFADPTADARFPFFKVPSGVGQIQVVSAFASTDTTLAEGDSNVVELTLQDGGSDGTGTATVGAAIDNLATGSHGAWTAATPKTFTITEVLLDEGDYLTLKYNETGTVAPKNTTVTVNYIIGKR